MESLVASQHSEGSCDNIQVAVIKTKDGGAETIYRLPVTSKTATMAMYSIPSECLGTNDEHFVECDKTSCSSHMLNAWMAPGEHIDIPILKERFRGLGACDDESGQTTYKRTTYKFPEGKCISDVNGTKFIFKSGSFVKTIDEISKAIETRTFEFNNMAHYLLTMKDAAWIEFKRQLKNNRIDMSMLFQCTGEREEDGTEEVTPEAAIVFMDLLYPNLIPGHDIIVCLPPAKDGKLVMEAAFNVRLSYPHFPDKIAILGAQHNDMATLESLQEVEENFYIYSNVSLEGVIPNGSADKPTSVTLRSGESFLPNIKNMLSESKSIYEKYSEARTQGTELDMDLWYRTCADFQSKCHEKIFDQLRSDGEAYGLKDFGKEKMYAINMIGEKIPKSTTFMILNSVEGTKNSLVGVKRTLPDNAVDAVDVEDALKNACFKLLINYKPGTEAILVVHAKKQNADYIRNSDMSLQSIRFDIMTDQHKMQIATMIESLISS